MRIEAIVCSERVEAKLQSKHGVRLSEVRQVFFKRPRIRFAEKGYEKGRDVYAAFGQSFGGRYLSVFFLYDRVDRTAIIISGRDMSAKERRAYGRK
jgi:uncharacterized DUF497 family protein